MPSSGVEGEVDGDGILRGKVEMHAICGIAQLDALGRQREGRWGFQSVTLTFINGISGGMKKSKEKSMQKRLLICSWWRARMKR